MLAPWQASRRFANGYRRARARAALAIGVVASPTGAQAVPASLATFLREAIAMKADEIRSVSGGTAIVKVLDTSDQREIAMFGIVRIGVPRSFYVRRAADFPSSLRSSSRLAVAIFSDPATPSNVARLSLPHDDVQDLAHCRAGSCKVKLSAETIAHLRAVVDFAAPSADSAVTAFFRARMIDYVAGYRARGDNALAEYDDRQPGVAGAEVFHAILSRSPAMYQYAPSLERYLADYPADRPPGVSEVIFWAQDDLPGLKPTITLTHEVVYAPPELPGSTLIASKMLYAAHYLDGALDLDAVVDQAASRGTGPPAVYLVRFRRLHFDNLPSGGLVNVRGKVIDKLRDRTATDLRDTQTDAERAYAGASGTGH